jgi:hypothetical protein
METLWEFFDLEGYTELLAIDHSIVLNVGMDTFRRYDGLLEEYDMGLTNPYEREGLELGWENIFYCPIEGLFVKAGAWGENGESPPHYIIAAQSNDSFADDRLRNLMALFLRAVNIDLTDFAASELMTEMFNAFFSLGGGAKMSIVYYGPWRLTLTILSNGEGVDGPTLFISPEEDAIQEPWNSSIHRIGSLRERFIALAKDDGFDLSESPKIECAEDVVARQFMREYMPMVW